ncbi:MAG: hypothetical protein K9I68_06305 [Bacteroidales bacterium]|nr:hypothetical protein [Bacteroidales bacterium]
MKHLYLVLALVLPFISVAQIDEMRDRLDDELRRVNEGELTLRYVNAENEKPVNNAKVHIDKLGDFTTDRKGRVIFDDPEKDGKYTFQFKKEGFIPLETEFEIAAGTIFYNRFAVSPVIDRKNLRIVMEWGENPPDLDAHLVKKSDYHISYRDMSVSEDGECKLDRDDRQSYGPETITIKDVDENGDYLYYVKDYTNRNKEHSVALSNSKVHVRVFDNSGMLKEWNITSNKRGKTWKVFAIEDGIIKDLNRLENRD